MNKIALILTGGTIGSVNTKHIIDVGTDTIYRLVSAYEEEYGEKNCFEFFSPFQCLSENFTKTEWQQLYNLLYDFPFEKYEGVVIAHGTDTLAYSAALIGMLFAYVSVPIVFVASNYPIGTPESNGVRNLRGAVEFIRGKVAPGVFVAYENQDREMEIHLATRLLPADNVLDQYGSFGGPCLGVVKEDGVFSYNKWRNNPAIELLQKQRPQYFKEKISFTKDILYLTPYPGQNYESIALHKNIGAVYHYLYHAGTACVQNGSYSILDFMKRCQEENIPFYVASLKVGNEDAYATGSEILQQGAIPLYDISTVAGYMKVLITYNQKEYKPEEILGESLFFENVTLL